MSEYLPQEMLIKILTRLPPKTLIKYKSVSKTWNSLISSPYFISAHTQLQILFSKPQTILRRYLTPLQTELYSLHREFDCEDLKEEGTEIEYPFRNLARFYFRIVGSCNGVLCLSDDLFGRPGPILLWNPSIKRKFVLPDSNNPGHELYSHVRVLGFGYDPEHNDYKVVRLSYVQGDNGYPVPPEAEVFTLSTKNWHKINPGQVPEKCVVEYFWSQVVINGNVHWVAYKDSGRQAKVENSIMVFDLSREVFDEMPLPKTLKTELPINLNALAVDGSLGVVHYNDDRVWGGSLGIWVMKKYGDSITWSKEYNVEFGRGPGTVLGIGKSGCVVLAVGNLGLISYDPVMRESDGLCVFGTGGSFYAGSYLESLVLLGEGEWTGGCVSSSSDSESESECVGDVEKSELWMQCSMSQYLTALLKRY